jgi:hypothetical protein
MKREVNKMENMKQEIEHESWNKNIRDNLERKK